MPERALADSSSSARTKIVLKDWSVGSEIGKGSYARVFLGRNKPSGLTVAIKDVDTARLNQKLKRHLRDEINILKSLQHPHIVALVDCHESSNHIYFMMEYCELGDMAFFIRKRDKLITHPATHEMARKYPNPPNAGLNEVIVRHFLKQLASALEYLRRYQLVHRDIKPQNLLLVPPPQYRESNRSSPAIMQASKDSFLPTAGLASLPMLKLADFGFARSLPSTALADTLCGSPLYMAPEILAYEKYDSKADLWSVGTVLYELITGRPHFRAQNHVELLKKIKDAKDVIKFPEKTVISRGLKECIRSLLKLSSVERISWEAFFAHLVVQEPIPGLVEDDIPKPTSPIPTGLSERRSLREMRAASKSDEPHSLPQSLQRRVSGRRYTTDTDQTREATPPSPRERSMKTAHPTDISKQPPGQSGDVVHRGSYSPRFGSGEGLGIRRPQPHPSTSAPNRPALREDQRRQSTPVGGQTSPTTSITDATRRQRPNTTPSRPAVDEKEKAALDVAFERDYVVVVKEQVEVNAFADEMAANPRVGGQAAPLSPETGQMVRRATQQGNPTSATGAIPTPPSRAMQGARGYPDRRQSLSGSPGSTASFITRAIHDAGVRLLGPKYPMSFISGKGSSPPQPFPAFPAYPAPSAPIGLLSDGKQTAPSLPLDEDARVAQHIEDFANRSDVVYHFAEVKYQQLIPDAPSVEHGLGGASADRMPSEEEEVLTVEAIVLLAEEALVLYVKSLSLLAKAMNIANMWWTRKSRSDSSAISTSPAREASSGHAYSQKINMAVQWIRTRFNEVLEKSEIAQLKLAEGQKLLPQDHPGHPTNHPFRGPRSSGSKVDDVYITPGISAEKLIYERAVEMSRASAINEITLEDLPGCELAYGTAINMLQAVLDSDDNDLPMRRISTSKDERDASRESAPSAIDLADQKDVQKMIDMITSRRAAVRQKQLNLARAQQQQQKAARRSFDITPRSVPAHGS